MLSDDCRLPLSYLRRGTLFLPTLFSSSVAGNLLLQTIFPPVLLSLWAFSQLSSNGRSILEIFLFLCSRSSRFSFTDLFSILSACLFYLSRTPWIICLSIIPFPGSCLTGNLE